MEIPKSIALVGHAARERGRMFTWILWPGGPWVQWGQIP